MSHGLSIRFGKVGMLSCEMFRRQSKNDGLATALAAVESFSAPKGIPDLRSEVLGFRADLKEMLGRVEAAKADFLTARSLVGATYGRYVHELSLASICRKLNQAEEAESWYRTALHTCLEGNISGGTALKEFLLLKCERTLSTDDRMLCSEVAERSWKTLGLAGRPDSLICPELFRQSRKARRDLQEKNQQLHRPDQRVLLDSSDLP